MAIAREAEIEWTLKDFDRLGEKVPHLADLKPGGKYVMLTCTGQAVRHKYCGAARRRVPAHRLHYLHRRDRCQNLKEVPSIFAKPQKIILPLEQTDAPHRSHCHLARQPRWKGSVAKVAGLKSQKSLDPPRSSMEKKPASQRSRHQEKIVPGDVVVIRGEGPVGGPGMTRDVVDHRHWLARD